MAATRPDKIVAGQVQFQTFCLLLEKISNLRRKERKKELFARFLEQWRRTHRKVNGDDVPEVRKFSYYCFFVDDLFDLWSTEGHFRMKFSLP